MSGTMTWQVGLLDAAQAEIAAPGYARQVLALPIGVEWSNPLPIIWCAARADWPTVVFAAIYRPDAAHPTIPPPALRTPDLSTTRPLPVQQGEQVVIPAGAMRFEYISVPRPRPYGVGPFGRRAYSIWEADTVIRFRAGAALLADVVDAPCEPWAPVPAPAPQPPDLIPVGAAAWSPIDVAEGCLCP